MKTIKTLITLTLIAALACLVLAGCGESDVPSTDPAGTNVASTAGTLSAEAEYRVTVVDASGNPFTTGVIVRFMQGTEQAAMVPVDGNGVGAKTLPRGEYSVELMFTGDESEYHYDSNGLTLSAEQTELSVVLSYTVKGEGRSLYGWSVDGSNKEFTAYAVAEGGTHVALSGEDRVYYLFTPTRAGTYEISLEGSDAVLGYYGAPHFVQQYSTQEPVDGKLTVSIKASMIGTDNTGTTVLVLGIDPSQEESCILNIIRTGEPQWTVEDEPWHVYQPTLELAPYVHGGEALKEFDLTASSDTYNLVLDDNGYYHLNSADGPLVLVRLGEASGGSKYLDSFQTILEHSGIAKYFYDESGNFVKKESYSECLLTYIEHMDEATGLYPLTEDLKYIIQMRGDHYGWFDITKTTYLFVDPNGIQESNINADISWLFMCCYAE